jgi:hypothetical protein
MQMPGSGDIELSKEGIFHNPMERASKKKVLLLGRHRQEDQEFNTSLGYIARPCLIRVGGCGCWASLGQSCEELMRYLSI